MARHHNYISQVARAVVFAGALTGTKYLAADHVVRVTQRRVRGKVPKRGNLALIVTVGEPNYRERKFIKACSKAGEPLPVRKVQFRFAPKPKRR